MRTVFVTGGIGSGKSAVCRYLSSCGVPVYDSDSRTKSLYDSRPALIAGMERALGVRLRDDSGALAKGRLASIIFSSPAARSAVEEIVHPAVLEDFQAWLQTQQQLPWCGYTVESFAVMESAIVMQKPLFRGVADKIVLVDAPEALRMERALRRDGGSREAMSRRMAAQHFDLSLADAVIHNATQEPGAMYAEVDRVFSQLFQIPQEQGPLSV